LPARNRTRRPISQGAKRRVGQELIDDQKSQQELEAQKFTSEIEREANESGPLDSIYYDNSAAWEISYELAAPIVD